MKNKKNDRKSRKPTQKTDLTEKDEAVRYLLSVGLLAVLTIVVFGFYQVSVFYEWGMVFWVYFATLLVSLVGYVVLNRGFSRANVKPDMLPETWSAVEKNRFFEEAADWKRRSRWVLYVIIPLVITFLYDTVKLLIIDKFFV